MKSPLDFEETTSRPRRSFFSRLVRSLVWVVGLLLLILAIGTVWFRWHVGQSVPQLDGEIAIEGLTEAVTVERDALGVPTIRGKNRLDVARGLGFIHGQERFFQMDLFRRQAAGELAELVGAAALGLDRRHRTHRFRTRAQEALTTLSAPHRLLLDAYVAGVNTGLSALGAAPFEYTILRTEPAPWRTEDTLLVVYTMYLDLQGSDANREMTYGVAHDVLPVALYEFLTAEGTEWDAPIDGEAFSAPGLPTAEEFDLRSQPQQERQVASLWTDPETTEASELPIPGVIGSNNWAVAGSHTTHGDALLADDMHLGHGVPNIWFRASLAFPDPADPSRERRITGVTLPGAMLTVAGSNGEVAWGFTNSYGDWSDLVILEPDPNDPEAYLTPEGPRRFERFQEELRAGGETVETLEVVETIWGPVWDTDHQGRQRVWRWVAHDERAVNLVLGEMETASTIDEAIEIASRVGTPAQNFVVADNQGRIGWTLMGPMPRRFGHEGRLPSSWADGSRGWDGWLWPEEYPRVIDPESGRIWTANNRVVSGDMLAKLGNGGYDLGARAGQIRDDLFAIDQADEASLLAVQLDDRALFLERWRDQLISVLTPEAIAADPRRGQLRRLLEDDWSGRASVDSAAYRLVRGFRFWMLDRLFKSLTAACKAADERFRYNRLDQLEGPLWRLVSEQPMHLLDPEFATWQEQFLSAVDDLIDNILANGGELGDMTWGARNRLRIRHPLSSALPDFASRWLDMPEEPAPGDSNMPRVQGSTFGASERMVVSPGHEDRGIFHMPGGQSGHPLSPHYGSGHEAWVKGEATSFLPSETVHTLTLFPAGG